MTEIIYTDIFSKLEFPKITEKLKSYLSTPLGSEKCDNIVFETEKTFVKKELDLTEEMRNLITVEGGIQLDGIRDVKKVISNLKIEGYFIASDKLLWVLDFLKISRYAKSFIKIHNDDLHGEYEKLSAIAENIFADKLLEHNIDATIDENGNVKDTASSKLKQIRNEIKKKSESLRKTLTRILKDVSDQDLTRDDIISLRDGRFVIPVKIENKRKVQGIIHSSSASGITVFIEPAETIEINNEITELAYEEKREVESLLKEISSQLALKMTELLESCEAVSELDFLNAKARYAIEINAVKPQISDNIKIINAFHPILLGRLKKENVVPLGFEIDESFNTVVITGPNAGGKTVSLKTIGILQLMVQTGMLVPCEPHSEFRLFNRIFVSIGDEQSIENNLSSFSSHLKYINEIIENADDKSLVLIDEICSGTDPNSGSALAEAILEVLSERGSVSVITTHIGELKSYAYKNKKVKNASLEFDLDTISPNFHFKIGIPGQSFTFEIARKYSIPERVIKTAKSYLTKSDKNTDDLIRELEENIQKYRKLKSENDIENSRLKGLLKIYGEKVNSLKQFEKEQMKSAREKAGQIISDANRLIEKTIKEIRESQNLKPAEIKNKFKKETEKVKNAFDSNDAETEKEKVEFKTGDTVIIKNTDTKGVIEDIVNNVVKINTNGIIIKSKLEDIVPLKRQKIKNEYSGAEDRSVYDFREIRQELDLRGLYPEEIEVKIEEFFNDALNSGLTYLRIIHGKGTGKLREKVQEILKKNKYVKSFRFGNWNEGDSGVTIIEM
ncbi:MAG: endonuclease MutS2 [Ignavibacteria bacterium]|nr:endonuclease MutS2 [Ignavibacteria bacterium]